MGQSFGVLYIDDYLNAANSIYHNHGFDKYLTAFTELSVTISLMEELHATKMPLVLAEIMKGRVPPGHCVLLVLGYPKIIAAAERAEEERLLRKEKGGARTAEIERDSEAMGATSFSLKAANESLLELETSLRRRAEIDRVCCCQQ